ncbi:MAG: acyltransferase [Gemmatimonadaceae bacterium]
MNWGKAIRRSLEEPGLAVRVALSIARGQYYRTKFRLLGRRVRIGRNFRVVGRLDIRGPGTVIFGDDCTVISTYLTPTTPYTHAPQATIEFGNRVLLTGTRLGCHDRIQVGDDAGLAEARIMDTDFHSLKKSAGPRYNTGGATGPVTIGRNAWVALSAIVLKGVTIGDNSVVGAGAVVVNDVPANAVVFGNPARVVWRLTEEPHDRSALADSPPPTATVAVSPIATPDAPPVATV